MASTTQIVPEHEYAHVMVVTHDNSARPKDTLGNADTTYCNMMFVFSSPKGIDRELQTISGGETDFVENYGIGSYDVYGQPFLNAYAAARTNAATLHCLRVTADNAAYSVGALVAHYKVSGGTSGTEEPVLTPSDKVDTMGHEYVFASDKVDENTGKVTVSIAGTNVEPGISEENAELFGELTGEYIDVTLDLSKVVNIDPAKTYQITQTNPALVEYVGKDPYVLSVGGQYTKTKTYTGEALADGYAILLSSNVDVTLSIVEWGVEEPVIEPPVKNNTDLGVTCADPDAKMTVTSTVQGATRSRMARTVTPAVNYNIATAGEVVGGVLNPELWGDNAGDSVEIVLNIPNLEDGKKYRMIQTNAVLEQFKDDPRITQINGQWTKIADYLAEDVADGIALLLGNGKGGATMTVREVTPAPVEEPVLNQTDLTATLADPKTKMTVVMDAMGKYGIDLVGEVVGATLNPDLWGTLDNDDYVELVLQFPSFVDSVSYKIVQTNSVLSKYSGDHRVSQLEDGTWQKVSTFNGSDLTDGIGFLLGDGTGDVNVTIYNAETDEEVYHVTVKNGLTFVTEHSVPEPIVGPDLMTVMIDNNYTFVDQHTPILPTEGPIGDPVEVEITGALSFTTTTQKSVMLRATARARSVVREITEVVEEPAEPGKMHIYYTFEAPADPVYDRSLGNLGNLVEVDGTPDANGYRAVKIFEMACRGRGLWGNNVRWKLDSYARGDRLSSYKNYILSVYEISNATLLKKEEFTIAFSPNAVNADGNTLYADYIVGDPYDNSRYIDMVSNPAAFNELFAAYSTVVPDTAITRETFDPLCGMMFGTTLNFVENLEIDSTSTGVVAVSGASGIALMGGSDGDFDVNSPNRQKAMEDAYLRAYSGEIDRNVRSKKMFPTDIILDANFPIDTKQAIHDLVEERQDCMGVYDLGLEFNTFAGLMEELANIEIFVISRNEVIEAYRGKIQDPVTFKIVPVTSTYALAQMFPLHFQQHGDKHVPMAGTAYGILSGFLSGTAWPVYDDDLDSKLMDTLTDNRVNYLKVNTKKQVVRGAQTTRQDIDTNLSEMSNMFILLDIRRDAIQLCEQYEYNFSEASDLQRFNKAAKILAEKYADVQVKSISAEFNINDWESERGILHLYIDFVHKNIIKRSIVEISVNRGTVVNN